MFSALRDCAPQLRLNSHEEEKDGMVNTFDKEIMANIKEVCQIVEFRINFE